MGAQISVLSLRTLGVCFLRTYLVGAAFNSRGLQNVGLIFSMEPGLRAIYPDPAKRQQARKGYLRHYNTHVFWTPLLVGVFLSLEAKISKGLFPRQVLDGIRDTTAYTLSAIGDSAFGGSLQVMWAMGLACLAAAGLMGWAWAWLVFWFIGLQIFKMATYILGLRVGLQFLRYLKRWNLIKMGARIKMVNAVLLVIFLVLLWSGTGQWGMFLLAAAALLAAGYVISKASVLRELVVILFFLVYLSLPWFKEWFA